MYTETGNLAILSSVRTNRKSVLADQPFHEMTLALQTTLELEQLLAIFSSHLQEVVKHEGYTYVMDKDGIEVSSRKSGRHACSYDLLLHDLDLGQLRLTRNKRFSELELATVEAYLCRLLFPLRNALQYREAMESAYLDSLTRTRNRGALASVFQREWELARRHQIPLSVILVDVDHFKRINDLFGHQQGDRVLQKVADCLKQTVRGSDIVFRYGGEEFVILLSSTPEDGAFQLAERIRHTLESMVPVTDGDGPQRVTASFGVATLDASESKESLLHRADLAMYEAKERGRNQVCLARGA
jgi:diguanylate cyclase (GGDEF)-like protein